MAALNDDDPGFWPGYVAAISGLVQGLLIMAMALGSAIFVLGQLARTPAAASAAPPVAARHDPDGFVPPLPLAPPPPAPVGQAGPAPAVAEREGPPARITAGFQGDAVQLPDSAVPGVLASIDTARAAGVQRWRITIAANLRDPRQQRAAYLRLLGLRSLLVQHGIAAATIDTWIEDSADESAALRTAWLEPLDAAGAALGMPGAER